MERSFARSKRYGFDEARWRGFWRMQIQDYLICAIQNIQVLAARPANQGNGLQRGPCLRKDASPRLYPH
jgi:hypothetical protein